MPLLMPLRLSPARPPLADAIALSDATTPLLPLIISTADG